MSFFTMKKWVQLGKESELGTWVKPTNPTFPINDVEIVANELGLAEYGRPANGKFSRGRYFSGAQSATVGFTSFMMKTENPATGTPLGIEPLFNMAGWNTDYSIDAGKPKATITWDGNANCQTYSMLSAVLGTIDGNASITANAYELRGMKTSLTIAAETIGSPILITAASTASVESYGQANIDVSNPVDFSNVAVDRFIDCEVTVSDATDGATPEDLNIQNFSFTDGATLVMEKSAAELTGGKVVRMTDADPKLSITCMVDETTPAIFTKATTNKTSKITISGQNYTYTFNDASISSFAENDAEGLLMVTVEYSIGGEITIATTETNHPVTP